MDILLVLLYAILVFLAYLACNLALREAQHKNLFAPDRLDGGSTAEPSGTTGSAMPASHQHAPESKSKRKKRASKRSNTTAQQEAENHSSERRPQMNADRVNRWRCSILRDMTKTKDSRPISGFASVNKRPVPSSGQAASLESGEERAETPVKANVAVSNVSNETGRTNETTTERRIQDITEKFARFYKVMLERERAMLKNKSMDGAAPADVPQPRQESSAMSFCLTKEQEKEIDAAFRWISSLTCERATPGTTGKITETDQKAWQEFLQAKANVSRLAEEVKQLADEIEAPSRAIEEKDSSRTAAENPDVRTTSEQEQGQGRNSGPEQANSQRDSDHGLHKGSEEKEEKVPESSPTTLYTDAAGTTSMTTDQASYEAEPAAEQRLALPANASRLNEEKQELAIQFEAIQVAAEREEEASKTAITITKEQSNEESEHAEGTETTVTTTEAQESTMQEISSRDQDQNVDVDGPPDDLDDIDSHFGSPFDSPVILPVDGSAPEPAPWPEDVSITMPQEPTISSPPPTPVQETDRSGETKSLGSAEGQNVLTPAQHDTSIDAVVMSDAELEQLAQKLEIELDCLSDDSDSGNLTQHGHAEGTGESVPESATDKADQGRTGTETEHKQDNLCEADSRFGSPFASPIMLPVDSSMPKPAPRPEDILVRAPQGSTVSSFTPMSSRETDQSKETNPLDLTEDHAVPTPAKVLEAETNANADQEQTSEEKQDVDVEGVSDDLDEIDSHFGSPFDSPEILPVDDSTPEPAPWPEEGPDIRKQ